MSWNLHWREEEDCQERKWCGSGKKGGDNGGASVPSPLLASLAHSLLGQAGAGSVGHRSKDSPLPPSVAVDR